MGGCTPSGADVNVIRVLLFVLESHDDQLCKLLLRMICEVVQTLNWNEHFHAKSVTTARKKHFAVLLVDVAQMQFQCINVTTQQL
ncbi:hypothetical protein PF002_g16335 [Phytophthora fragariae]|uniref:Uncharacterized protein n=1 Tax=Phytophthora fragariae TaxID=53985 RepID=A0A6A3YH79_9STRA|nr:hypothetical protein PF004_g22135 [Phytophthora fragariae]KAE9218956.1 hypothetical protein PF002_g16335 [Phytophthora fragariae]KAE9279120.1 hypothetical protein PF001_g24865 [Phytophthora fragariae]